MVLGRCCNGLGLLRLMILITFERNIICNKYQLIHFEECERHGTIEGTEASNVNDDRCDNN